MPEEPDIPTGILRFPNGGLNFTKVIVGKEEEEDNTEESEEDNDSDGTRPHKVNTAPGPKRALKTLRVQKRTWLYEGQPSGPPEGLVDVLATIATAANVLPSTMPTLTNETSSTEPSIRTSITPDLPSVEDLKSQLEAKEAVIARLQDEVKKLLRQIEGKNLEITKQALEIQLLRRQQSHAPTVHDVWGPLNVDAHAHDTNMLVDNDVIENVVATITTGILEDILTPVCKRASVVLPPPSLAIQSLNT
jgi:pterin-4a-carbinolamine dehydratase